MKLFGCYFLVPIYDFCINLSLEMPRIVLAKTSKQSLPAFTSSISGKTRGDGKMMEKWLWYLDSATLNYPGTVILISVIFLVEMCVIECLLYDIKFFVVVYRIVCYSILHKSQLIKMQEPEYPFRGNWGMLNHSFFSITSSFPGNWGSKCRKWQFWRFGQGNAGAFGNPIYEKIIWVRDQIIRSKKFQCQTICFRHFF